MPTAFTMTSPTAGGVLPERVTPVGGIVLDLVGLSGRRVVAQVAAGELFVGFFSRGEPAEFRGNPGTIGVRSGFSPELIDLLGGGLAELAVRLTVFDGDSGPGDFDEGDNTLLINGEPIGRFDAVPTVETDESGLVILSENPDGGFRDERLDTGFFHLTDPDALARIHASLRSAGSAAFQLLDDDPFDNTFDFTLGVGGGLVDVDLPPEPENAPPRIESFAAVGPVLEGIPARLVVAASDPDLGDSLAFEFDLDGDGLFEPGSPAGEAFPVFPVAGIYLVTARVRDGLGASDEATLAVVVANVAPTLRPPGDQEAAEGAEAPFSLGAFDDPGAEDSWTVAVDWGDGSPSEFFLVDRPGPLPPRPHRYARDGAYTVLVTVSDGRESAEATFLVGVANVAPTLRPPGTQAASEGAEALLALGAFDDPGADEVWTVVVDWGDGSPSESFRVDRPGPLPPRPHRYLQDGAYTVTVRVGDGADWGEASHRVRVRNEPPRLQGVAVPGRVGTGAPLELAAAFTDPGPLDSFRARIDWGDGSSSTLDLGAGSTSIAARHAFDRPGSYVVTLIVSDDRGASAILNAPVVVVGPSPSGSPFSAPTPPPVASPVDPASAAGSLLAAALLPADSGLTATAPVGPGLASASASAATGSPAAGQPIAILVGASDSGEAPRPAAPASAAALPPTAPAEDVPPPTAPAKPSAAEGQAAPPAGSGPAAVVASEGASADDGSARQAAFLASAPSPSSAPASTADGSGADADAAGAAESGGEPGSKAMRTTVLIVAVLSLRRRSRSRSRSRRTASGGHRAGHRR